MTKNELIKNLAWLREEAGLEPAYPINHPMAKFIMAISERAKAQEREACAAIVGDMPIQYERDGKYCMTLPEDYEAAIRARGEA